MPEPQTNGLNVGEPESGHRPPEGRFQVLSIDGGGIRGLFAAKVLEIWETQLGHPVIDHFDLLMGTSTGGIIALGLAAGMPAKELVSFYERDGAKIFPKYGQVAKWLREGLNWVRPKYCEDPLNEALQRRFGSAKLCELKCKV